MPHGPATPPLPASRPPSPHPAARPASPTMRPPGLGGIQPCPRCAEPIRSAASVCRWCGHDLGRPLGRASAWSELRKRIPGFMASSIVLVALLVTGAFFMFRGAGYPPELRARFVNSCGLPGACGCLLEHLETQGVPGSAVMSFLDGDLARSTSVFEELDNGLVICGVSEGPDARVSRTAGALQKAAIAEDGYAAEHGKFTYSVEGLLEQGLMVPRDVTLEVVEAGEASYCIEARHKALASTYFLDSDRGAAVAGNC